MIIILEHVCDIKSFQSFSHCHPLEKFFASFHFFVLGLFLFSFWIFVFFIMIFFNLIFYCFFSLFLKRSFDLTYQFFSSDVSNTNFNMISKWGSVYFIWLMRLTFLSSFVVVEKMVWISNRKVFLFYLVVPIPKPLSTIS